MNVCFFVGNINLAGGTERVASLIANELQARGYRVYVLNLQFGDSPFFKLSDDIKIGHLFSSAGRGVTRLPIAIKKIRDFVIKNEIDVFVSVESMLFLYAFSALLGLKVKHICWEHFNYNVDLGKPVRRLARKLAARFADNVITLTKRDRELWLAHEKCKADIITIPNPVTVTPALEINREKRKIFLAIGRLTYQKGFDLLLQAWAKVSPLYPDWSLRIIGDGEDKSMLESIVRELNINGSVELLPTTDNVSEHYQETAFFIMSSRFEGFGLVLVEAQTYGNPVVSFDCDFGPKEIILNNESGWLCEPNNIVELSEKIALAISTYRTPAYDKLSVAARVNSDRFSVGNIISSWVNILMKKNTR
ncbi:glycosyltransferase family 4 protein [Aeromonas enteropelogenes]|uniref:glycosyltransferase family 4 protein n=1 Tax=Aeromonas enteropelogenes TaxID=29489 RepID=UPI001CE30504|nr:glycosyltransferase family 4 protein [Aeromonas enteropelogenes]UCA10513.1 glycosyltransferase family 4 protein [Aeromonas enteropelogenes]